jgi:hypothetical protein
MQPDQNSPDLLHYQPATPPASSANSGLAAWLGDQDFYTAEQVAERVSSAVQEVAISYEQRLSVIEAELQRLREYVVALPVPPLESPSGVSQPPFTQLPSTVRLSQPSNGSCSVSRLTRTISSLSIEDGAIKRALEADESEHHSKFTKYDTDDTFEGESSDGSGDTDFLIADTERLLKKYS